MKAVAAFDSFKGCMGSVAAGQAAALGVTDACPDAEVDIVCMADGGEGTLEALRIATGLQFVSVNSHDALMRPVRSRILYDDASDTAYVELAESAGITLLSENERHVTDTTTYGFGECIAAAVNQGAKSVTCTLGGSATNDLGLGALQAMGLRIFTANGELTRPVRGRDLIDITGFDASALKSIRKQCSFGFMYDADIPLTGPNGAVKLYAPQKGATIEELEMLEQGVERVASTIHDLTGISHTQVKGAGAAGGAGYGLAAFLGAEPLSGADAVLDICGFDNRISGADFVLTGEGRADAQTLQGKVAEAVRRRASSLGIPVIVLAGSVSDRQILLDNGFADVIDINVGYSPAENPLLQSVASSRLRLATTMAAQTFMNN